MITLSANRSLGERIYTQIWVTPLLTLKMGLPYRYSVGGYMYYVGDPFWVWILQWVSCWRIKQGIFLMGSSTSNAHDSHILLGTHLAR